MTAHKLRNIILLFLSLILSVTLCGCVGDLDNDGAGQDGASNGTEDQTQLIERTLSFDYEDLYVPEEITGGGAYVCYQDASCIIFSVRSRNGKDLGPLYKADFLALYHFDGKTTYYPLETEADIISVLPYQNGLLYVDYTEPTTETTEWSIEWAVVLTDGQNKTVLDTGTVYDYNDIPYLFFVQEYPYYLCKNQGCFTIKKLVDTDPYTVHTENVNSLADNWMAGSNGNEYCYMINYPNDEYAHFIVANDEGVLYNNRLNGKITSYTITDKYAVCVTGIEETGKCSVEVVDLSTGGFTLFSQPYGTSWQLTGTGSICICVNDHWQPYAIDIESQKVVAIPLPQDLQLTGKQFRVYPIEENRFVIFIDGDTEQFFFLTVSEE